MKMKSYYQFFFQVAETRFNFLLKMMDLPGTKLVAGLDLFVRLN